MMTVREYLGGVRFIAGRIQAYRETIEELKKNSRGLVATYNDMPKAVNYSGLEELIGRLTAEEAKYKKEMLALIELRQELIKRINSVQNDKWALMLHHYYVNGYTIEVIGKITGVSYRTAWEIKADAETEFARMYGLKPPNAKKGNKII